jgi:hypothetical protein
MYTKNDGKIDREQKIADISQVELEKTSHFLI